MDTQLPADYHGDSAVINQIARQLDRLEERTRDVAKRGDLEALRKELVARESLEPQLNALKARIERVDADRIQDRKDWEEERDEMKNEQLSRQDRLWIRILQAVGVAGFIIAMFQFLSHIKIMP
jgi:hypothetical protein